MRWFWLLFTCALVLAARPAWAFVVPPVQGHVTDAAGKLTDEERKDLNLELERLQSSSGNHIVVFLPASLQGETIEDVAYQVFQTWKIGEQKLDNGVLLVIAPAERAVRIETGKGVGGELTDLECSLIIREKIKPRLAIAKFHDAIHEGALAISGKLAARSVPPHAPARKQSTLEIVLSAVVGLSIIGLIVGFFVFVWKVGGLLLRRMGYSGSGGSSNDSSYRSDASSTSYSSDSSYSSSSSDSSSSSYGGYEGGGGSSGGGGASDSW